MRHIRVHGQAKKHHHPILGINGRLDTIQAAVVLAKLDIFDEEVTKRQQVAAIYNAHLTKNASITLPPVAEGNTSVYAQYTILSEEQDQISAGLKRASIPSVSYYAVPLHLQPVFKDLGHDEGNFPITERVARKGLSLPMNPYLTEEEIQQICAVFR